MVIDYRHNAEDVLNEYRISGSNMKINLTVEMVTLKDMTDERLLSCINNIKNRKDYVSEDTNKLRFTFMRIYQTELLKRRVDKIKQIKDKING